MDTIEPPHPASPNPKHPEDAETGDLAQQTHWVKEAAKALGFSTVAVLPVTSLESFGPGLDAWLEAGLHGDMTWMERHRELRLNPAQLMEGTQSIVVVTLNYFIPEEPDQTPDTPLSERVKLAKYARGQEDYHRVIKKKLNRLLKQIQQWAPHAKGRALTDSAPILEKALAAIGGLGWVGKHSNLIAPQSGSWFFIGELLLTIPLTYDAPPMVSDMCGRCNRCIDACPTDAIVADCVVDATRCIAYWTIEYRGEEIPEHIASHMAGWVFGCDICQDVCPWNTKFALPTSEPGFQPAPWNQTPSAHELLNLTETTFQERYHHTPLQRTGLKNLQRNVLAWQEAISKCEGDSLDSSMPSERNSANPNPRFPREKGI